MTNDEQMANTKMTNSQDGHLSWRIGLAYLILFAMAVPWYWRYLPLEETAVWLGMPAWVVAAIFVSVMASLLTAWVLRRRWPEEADARAGEQTR